VGHECPRGVEHHGVAHRPLGAGQHGAHLGGVGRGVTATQLVELGAREPESGGIELELVDGAGLHPPDGARGGGGELVETVVAVHHQHTGPACSKHTGHHLSQLSERTADQPRPRSSRIGQRPKQIEHRRHPDLAAHHRRMAVGRMKLGREAKADTELGEAAGDLFRPQVDAHPERLEGVGAAGQRGRRPVAVLDHRHARGRHHDRGHGGQIDRVHPVAAGANDVDRVVGDRSERHRTGVVEHHAGQFADFVGRRALHLHRHRERRDLGRLGRAGHDLVHRPGGLTAQQVLPVSQAPQHPRPRRRGGRTILRRRSHVADGPTRIPCSQPRAPEHRRARTTRNLRNL